jgi:hypothetical protein
MKALREGMVRWDWNLWKASGKQENGERGYEYYLTATTSITNSTTTLPGT